MECTSHPKVRRCEGVKHRQRAHPMTNCARAHTNDPRLVRSKIQQKGALKEVNLEQNKTCILLRLTSEGRAHITQTSNNLYEKKYSIGKKSPVRGIFLKVPPQRTDARVWKCCSKRRSLGGLCCSRCCGYS